MTSFKEGPSQYVRCGSSAWRNTGFALVPISRKNLNPGLAAKITQR